jgi:hypothetical protein
MDFEKRISQYVALRRRIKELDDAHAEKMRPMREALDTLNVCLLDMLKATKQDNAKTPAGTAYKKTTASATIADMGSFRRHVIGAQDFDLVDWRANPVAVRKFIEENEAVPPGVTFVEKTDVGVRAANGKADKAE